LAILASRFGRRTPAFGSPDARIYAALEPLSGSHRVWGGLAPDYTLSEAQEVLKSQHAAEHLAVGVAGYKLDECDGSELTGASWMFPAHATFPSGRDGGQMRQVYGLLLQKRRGRRVLTAQRTAPGARPRAHCRRVSCGEPSPTSREAGALPTVMSPGVSSGRREAYRKRMLLIETNSGNPL